MDCHFNRRLVFGFFLSPPQDFLANPFDYDKATDSNILSVTFKEGICLSSCPWSTEINFQNPLNVKNISGSFSSKEDVTEGKKEHPRKVIQLCAKNHFIFLKSR